MLIFFPVTSSPSVVSTARRIPFSQLSHFPTKTHKFNLSFSPLGTQFRTGFRPVSLKSAKKRENSALELEEFDDEDVFDYDDDDDEDDDVDDDDDEFVPLRNMKKWAEDKPRGFGDGKEYDTSVEDKLLDEMQQSREAQLANINKLKNSSQMSNSKIGVGKKASDVVPSGIRVRLSNLPRKKNIDRDLQRAFKGIPGILNIIPAVSGNKKTREPVCKGFAFVDLKSQDYAHRFAKVVSGQSISFGKIEKQIKCDVMSSNAQNFELEQSIDTGFSANDSYSDSRDSVSSEEREDTNESVGHLDVVTTNESVSGSKSLKQLPKFGAKEKKQEVKKKKLKVPKLNAPKLNIPGSANRLKVREKAMLTGVLSKYAATSPLLQEQR